MTRTMADHSRAYRQRKAAKLERMEAALREIAEMPFSHGGVATHVARKALGDVG